jgi:DNA polymerase III subunit epsilon
VSAPFIPLDGVRLERDGGLVRRALRLLEHAPLPTAGVASQVMGISGAPKAAAAAVFALLGTDPRFRLSPDGVWSLAGPTAPPADAPVRTLRDESWVVVDVETTGASPDRGDRITEVAAVCVTAGEIGETYCTLVNPERRIPRMITALTGISQSMVADKPRFCDVAEDVCAAMEGRVFVAHNAAFDWRFVRHELSRATGLVPSGRQLCTVRLARRLLPELPSRSLDGLAAYFGLEIESRHRALDDAVATAHLLLRMIGMLEDRGITDWSGVQGILGTYKQRTRGRRALPRSMESA